MRVLVAGATSVPGLPLLRELSSRGHEVIGGYRSPRNAERIRALGAEAIAGVASVIAVAIVTTMVLWMRKAAASMSGQLRGDMARALEAGSFAVLSLSFLAVGREGVETGVDVDALVGVARWLEGVLGRRLEGQLHRAARWPG